MKKILLLCFLLIGTTIALAQPKVQLIQVSVSPDNPDWLYKIGDRVKFNVVVYKIMYLFRMLKLDMNFRMI